MQIKSKVPAGVRGPWCVEKFTVSAEDEKGERMRAMFSASSGGRFVPAGEYTRLMRGMSVIMSDTPDEIRDFDYFVRQATGTVLINGLGLGLVVQAMLEKPTITEITVIEIDNQVIKLVLPHLADPRLTVYEANALDWKPPKGKRWNYVWHDIWDGICSDNLPEMARLHRKYARRCDHQASWCKAQCLQMRGTARRYQASLGW